MEKLPIVELFDQSKIRYHGRVGCSYDSVYRWVAIGNPRAYLCRHKAAWKINGRPLCKLHAGYTLLLILGPEDEQGDTGGTPEDDGGGGQAS